MDKSIMPVAVATIAFVVAVGLYFTAPVLQSAETVVNAEADRLVETARRSLWQFSANQERLAVLADALGRTDADAPQPDAKVKDTLAQNEQYVADALRAVNEALAITRGDVGSARHLGANRLKGAILYHQAVGAHRKAQMLRCRADACARQLIAQARRVEGLQTETNLVSESNIHQPLTHGEEKGKELAQKRDELQAKIDRVRSTIDDLSSRLAQARQRADEARAAMEKLEEAGVDLTDPEGFEKFAAAYSTHAKTYHEAIRQTQELQFGTLLNARIDDSGDLVHGAYVPASGAQIETQRGLDAFQRDLALAELEMKGVTDRVEANKADWVALIELKRRYAAREKEAKTQIAAAHAKAKDEYQQFSRMTADVDARENDALGKLDQALRALRTAETSATERARVDTMEMSPEKLKRSPENLIQNDTWIPANVQCQSSDVLVRQGMIYFDRFRNAGNDIEMLAQIEKPLALSVAADRDAPAAKRDEAKENGVAAAEEASELLTRSARNLDQHWTLPAQVAGARYLLVLFGQDTARDNVIANYQQAITDREESPHVKAYEQRLKVLRQR